MSKFVSLILIFSILLLSSCTNKIKFRKQYSEVNDLLYTVKDFKTTPYLKAYLKNGDLYIFKQFWEYDVENKQIIGYGKVYDYERNLLKEDKLFLDINEVTLFETNVDDKGKIPKNDHSAITVLAVANIGLAIWCYANPKSCFGSCPTFYINEDDNLHYSDAEGFSSAYLPILEYPDIDALDKIEVNDAKFSIKMKNEALESHYVKNVKLLAYPVVESQRVYHSIDNKFYLSNKKYPLTKALANEGDISRSLVFDDMNERFSASDSFNLSSKEEIVLTFENVNSDDLGLLLNFRQTQMTTYIFYSMLSYMGAYTSDFFFKMNSDEKLVRKGDAVIEELGGIDVYVFDEYENEWKYENSFNESGPIAVNKQILKLKTNTNKNVKVKLILNKGLWRLDYASLVNIIEEVQPLELEPTQIIKNQFEDEMSLNRIKNPNEYINSYPGDKFEFIFEFPNKIDQANYDLFLFSEGYYLEWMRDEWIKDQNFDKLLELVLNPKTYLKNEAKSFKEYEKDMEEIFWETRIGTKIKVENK